MRRPSRVIAVLVAASLASPAFALVTSTAHAQSATELTAARELFEQGLVLESALDWDGALAKFRKVAAVKTTPQVRFHLALCLEKTGKLVDALDGFMRAQAETAGETKGNNVVVHESAGKHIVELRERIPRVIIQVPEGVAAIAVTIDGDAVAPSLLGAPIRVDPKVAHKIAASAPGRLPWRGEVTLDEGQKPLTVEVVLPPGAAETAVDKASEPPNKDAMTTRVSHGVLPWVVMGSGAVVAGTGVIFHFVGQSKLNDVKASCPSGDQCPASLKPTYDSGNRYNTIGNVMMIAGAGVVIVGVILYFVGPTERIDAPATARTPPRITLGPAPTPLGLGVLGSF